MQDAKTARSQQIADDNRQLDAHLFQQTLDLTLYAHPVACELKEESAEENSSSRSAKGNKYMRRVLNQAAHAAARSKGTHLQAVFRRLLPRLGYQSAVWAIAHHLCRLVWKILHEGIRYIEQGIESEPKLLIYRAKYLADKLR